MFATAIVAVVVSIVAVGIQNENSLGWGVVISLTLLPVLFLAFCFVVMMANGFCKFGTSFFGPLKNPASSLAVADRDPQKLSEPIDANASLVKETKATEAIDEA